MEPTITPLVNHPHTPAACGLDMRKDGDRRLWNHHFAVTVEGRERIVILDRWD